MQTKEYRTVDKSEWGPGPWADEPDKIQWQDEVTGLPCLIVRGPAGALCGYVGVAEGHACFGKEYGECEPITPAEDSCGCIDVHGGLTFSDFCADSDDESKHICHVPDSGEPDHVWWLGFDCAHSWDLLPKYADDEFLGGPERSYRTVAYVKREVERLARQLSC